MIRSLIAAWKSSRRFPEYEPEFVTFKRVWDWARQFPPPLQRDILSLLNKIIYISKEEVREALLSMNEQILKKLANDGIGIQNVIYVQIDSAGSSSPVMLNMLRNYANLERRGARFVDSKHGDLINQYTSELRTGALIYVDDFAGTGRQFRRNRDFASDFIAGNFSEFFIAPCICEEAKARMLEAGVIPYCKYVHTVDERPLNNNCNHLAPEKKGALVDLCRLIHPHEGLGFKKMATMVVLYRNAPNTVPLLFRGSLGQNPYFGILPRHDDKAF